MLSSRSIRGHGPRCRQRVYLGAKIGWSSRRRLTSPTSYLCTLPSLITTICSINISATQPKKSTVSGKSCMSASQSKISSAKPSSRASANSSSTSSPSLPKPLSPNACSQSSPWPINANLSRLKSKTAARGWSIPNSSRIRWQGI